jgi:hypothetical protein
MLFCPAMLLWGDKGRPRGSGALPAFELAIPQATFHSKSFINILSRVNKG